MQVRSGWSGETAPNVWHKLDVTVDEGDLHRILSAAGLPPQLGPELPTTTAYQLLDIEAETLLLAKLITRFGHNEDTVQRLQTLAVRKTTLLGAVAHE